MKNVVHEQLKSKKFHPEVGETKVTGAFKVDTSKGSLDGTVSAQWANRPADQRYLDLSSLEKALDKRQAKMEEVVVQASRLNVHVEDDQPMVKLGKRDLSFTNYSFGYLAYLADARSNYLRKLSPELATRCLREGLERNSSGETKVYHDDEQAWAFTSATYGRIYDADVVRAVRQVAGNGTGDTRWKIPGCIDWLNGTYNPFVQPDIDSTTIYASDRDVFVFLVDDTHPIEVGKLADGKPDYVFRGFYVWNSEVGARSFGISTFLLRGVCCNRNLWGVEDQTTLKIRHTKQAPQRFLQEVAPALQEYSRGSAKPVIEKVVAAKKLVLVKTDEQRERFLMGLGLTRAQAQATVKRCVEEEGHAPESAWDLVNGITAFARLNLKTDERLAIEKKAAGIMEKVK